MNKPVITVLLFVLAIAGCKSKPPAKKYIPVLILIKNQVAMVDTSLFSIMKIVSSDSAHRDTTHIKREDFEAAAKDFLSIPDLHDEKIAAGYQEESQYDSTYNRAIFTYTPLHPDNELVKQQQVITQPGALEGKTVKNIYITKLISNRDSFMRQNLLWQMDRSFSVTTILQKPGQPETITTTKVIWNNDLSE